MGTGTKGKRGVTDKLPCLATCLQHDISGFGHRSVGSLSGERHFHPRQAPGSYSAAAPHLGAELRAASGSSMHRVHGVQLPAAPHHGEMLAEEPPTRKVPAESPSPGPEPHF